MLSKHVPRDKGVSQRINRRASGKLGMGPGKGIPGSRNGMGKDMQCDEAWKK